MKPSNIKVRPDGTVKVLDFGLAKAVAPAGLAATVIGSPTITSPARLTGAGVIVGTAAYMSPEQARGQEADRASDVWAFGCVLYEMLAGRAAFGGGSVAEVIGDVLKSEPDWTCLPAETPPGIRRLIRRCLTKDRRERLRYLGDARFDLTEREATPASAPSSPRRLWWRIAAGVVAVAAIAAIGVLGAANRGLLRELNASRTIVRLDLNLPRGVELHTAASPNAVVSPDGRSVAFSATAAGQRQIYLRRLDEDIARPLNGTETANQISFSPQGNAILFVASDRTLRTVALGDGLVNTVARGVDRNSGAAWGSDGRITFVRDGHLWQVVPGAAESPLTSLDATRGEVLHLWPAVVGARHTVLFTVVSGPTQESTRIDAVDPDTHDRRTLVESARFPLYAPSGHLVFLREGALVAAPLDVNTLTLGAPVRVAETVAADSLGAPLVSISPAGHLVLVGAESALSQLVWVTRQGLESPASASSGMFEHPRVSADGRRIAVASSGTLWVMDLDRQGMSRLTPEPFVGSSYATWTPDGRRIYFRTATGLAVAAADGSGRPQLIDRTTSADFPNAVSPDGATLLITRQTAGTSGGIYAMPISTLGEVSSLVDSAAYEGGAQLSPDGRWLAYASNESGHFEVFVRPYPALDRRWTVSVGAGSNARWSHDGHELYYREDTRMFAVSFKGRPEAGLPAPQLLFDRRYKSGTAISFANYDVAADGRFLMVKGDSDSGRLSVVLNWTQALSTATR